MFRRMITRMGLPAIAGLSLLLIGGPVKAQQGWPINGSNWSFYGGSSMGSSGGSSFGSYSPSYYSPPSYSASYYSHSYYSPPYYVTYPSSFRSPAYYYGSTSTEGYYSTSTAASRSKRPVLVNLRVPSEAKIWIDGSETKQTGTNRSFESPPVTVGREYAYQIRVQWNRDGKEVTQTRQVTVHAGDVINLTIGSPPEIALAR